MGRFRNTDLCRSNKRKYFAFSERAEGKIEYRKKELYLKIAAETKEENGMKMIPFALRFSSTKIIL